MRLSLGLGFFILLVIIYSLLFSHIPINSDCASYFLQAQDMVNGNVFLKNWTLTMDTYYSIDTAFLAVAMLIAGPSLKLFYIVPAIVFALMVLLTLALSKQKSYSFFSFCFIFIMLGLPSLNTANLSFGLIAYHAGSLLYCLLILFCIIKLQRPVLKALLCFFLTYLVCLGDPWVDFVLVLPLLMVWLLGKKQAETQAPLAYLPFVFLSAVILAHLSVWLLSHVYPISIAAIDHKIDSPKESLLALIFLLINFAHLAGIYIQAPKYFTVIHQLGLIIMIWGFLRAIKNWQEQDWLNRFFITSIITMAAAFILSEASMGSYLAQAQVDIFSARYLSSCYVFGIILSMRVFKEDMLLKAFLLKDIKGLMAILLALNLYYFIPLLFLPKPEPPVMPAIQWLEKNQYSHGYGNYWEASAITVMSSGKLTVRPIINPIDSNEITPDHWLTKSDWYSKTESPDQGNFIIFNSRHPDRLDLAKIILNFGKPGQIITINGYTILIWNKNISNKWQ